MYQETNSANTTKNGDFMLLSGLILLVITAKGLMNAAGQTTLGGILQLVIFIGAISLCYFLYKKRFAAYRYTLFNKDPELGELDEFGDQKKNPFPLGTFIIEQISGSRSKAVEIIAPGELMALLRPGEALIGMIGGGASKPGRPALLTVDSASAHTLIYRRNGKLLSLRFSPSKELESMLLEIISAVNRA